LKNTYKYHITLVENGVFITAFEMKQTNEKECIIIPPAPEWIFKEEPTLSRLINRRGNTSYNEWQ
ncbi:MAG TPA: hypothetical protein VD794_02480, partial [Flavisolibacter sp.]|nr:hypothetical protein [Flavisolibacter sp.]